MLTQNFEQSHLIGTQGPKGGLHAAELAILEVSTGQETYLDTQSF